MASGVTVHDLNHVTDYFFLFLSHSFEFILKQGNQQCQTDSSLTVKIFNSASRNPGGDLINLHESQIHVEIMVARTMGTLIS